MSSTNPTDDQSARLRGILGPFWPAFESALTGEPMRFHLRLEGAILPSPPARPECPSVDEQDAEFERTGVDPAHRLRAEAEAYEAALADWKKGREAWERIPYFQTTPEDLGRLADMVEPPDVDTVGASWDDWDRSRGAWFY